MCPIYITRHHASCSLSRFSLCHCSFCLCCSISCDLRFWFSFSTSLRAVRFSVASCCDSPSICASAMITTMAMMRRTITPGMLNAFPKYMAKNRATPMIVRQASVPHPAMRLSADIVKLPFLCLESSQNSIDLISSFTMINFYPVGSPHCYAYM